MIDMRALLATFALVMLAACGSTAQRIPNYDNVDGLKRVIASLSPWKDGSPDRSNDGLTPGDEKSDRRVFGRWFMRYANHEIYIQHDRDYKPFPVPGSVGAAIAQQREFEREASLESEVRRAEQQAEQERAEAGQQAAEDEADRRSAAEDAQAVAAAAAKSAQDTENDRCHERRERAANTAFDAAVNSTTKATATPVPFTVTRLQPCIAPKTEASSDRVQKPWISRYPPLMA